MQRVWILVIALLLAACAGGGGSSGGSSSDGSGSNAKYGVRLLNASLDLAPLGMQSGANPALYGKAAFARPSYYEALPEGDQVVSVVKANAVGSVVLQQPVTVSKERKIDLLVYGDRGELGIHAGVISSERPELSGAEAGVRFIHALNGAASLGVAFGAGASFNLEYGTASEYQVVPAGSVTYSATRSVDGRLVASSSVELQSGRFYTVLLCGEVGYFEVHPLYTD